MTDVARHDARRARKILASSWPLKLRLQRSVRRRRISAPAVMSRGARKKMLPRNRSLTKNKSGLSRRLPLTLAFTKFDGAIA